MNLILVFKNIVDNPKCKIFVNNQELYNGSVKSNYNFDLAAIDKTVDLIIEHYDKNPDDTVVDSDNNIIRDRSFEIEKIIVDGYDFENLIWKSFFESTNGDIYNSCLFFGPNGSFKIQFKIPILKWILENTHEPGSWEEDYEYYTKAISIIDTVK